METTTGGSDWGGYFEYYLTGKQKGELKASLLLLAVVLIPLLLFVFGMVASPDLFIGPPGYALLGLSGLGLLIGIARLALNPKMSAAKNIRFDPDLKASYRRATSTWSAPPELTEPAPPEVSKRSARHLWENGKPLPALCIGTRKERWYKSTVTSSYFYCEVEVGTLIHTDRANPKPTPGDLYTALVDTTDPSKIIIYEYVEFKLVWHAQRALARSEEGE